MPKYETPDDNNNKGSSVGRGGSDNNNNNSTRGTPTIKTVETKNIGDKGDIWVDENITPIVMARIFKQSVLGIGVSEGSVRADDMPTIQWNRMKSGDLQLELSFHEKLMDNEFRFKSRSEIGGTPVSPITTGADDLGGKVGPVADIFEDIFNVEWEFVELSGASIGWDGEIVDFEFKYEGFTDVSRLERVDIGE